MHWWGFLLPGIRHVRVQDHLEVHLQSCSPHVGVSRSTEVVLSMQKKSGIWLSQLFPKISQLFYSRFLRSFSYYSTYYSLIIPVVVPSPRALRLPLGSGLQWSLLFRVRPDKAGAFWASNTDLVELDDPLLTILRRLSQPCGTHGMRMCNTYHVIYFVTFYLLFLFSNSCPINIPEYLA